MLFPPLLVFSSVRGLCSRGTGLQECDIRNLEICEEKQERERKKKGVIRGRREALGEEIYDLLFSEPEDT